MKYVVTGAAGFIGRHLVERLADGENEVVALDRRAMPNWKNVRAIRADLCGMMPGNGPDPADVVFHLAGRPGVRDSWDNFDDYLTDNLLATQRLLEAAGDFEKLVYASSSSVYGHSGFPISPYGVTKDAVEKLCCAYGAVHGIQTVGLRYFTVYGPGQRPDMAFARFIDQIDAGKPVTVLGDGTQTRRFTFIEDVVDATIAAAEAQSGVYDVASDEATSINDVLKRLNAKSVVHLDEAPGDPMDSFEPVNPLPGFTAQTSIEDGLSAQLAAWPSKS